jgi:tartrate-resistant acid phosphatase type 5
MLTIGVIGDFGIKSKNSAAVAEMVKSWSPKVIVTVGDNLYSYPPSEKCYSSVVGSLYKEYLPEKKPTHKCKKIIILCDKFRKHRPLNTKFLPCVGNHDHPFPSYTNYFGLDTYYSAEFSETHYNNLVKLISLNNYIDHDGRFERKNSIQRQWLERELKESSNFQWIIVYFHYPQLCSNSEDEENEQKSKNRFPFHDYTNVALIMSGHHHIYERLKLNGITNVVVGTSGHSVRKKAELQIEQSEFQDDSGYGALILEINRKLIKGTYFVVNWEDKVKKSYVLTDSFEIVKD